jgi:hypothetical protein
MQNAKIFIAPSILALPWQNNNLCIVEVDGKKITLALHNNNVFACAHKCPHASGIMADAGWRTADARRALIGTAAPFRYTKFNSDNDNYVPVIRYAEVMLNLAEALARTNTAGVDARALALLNAVRQRSDAGATLAPTTNAELLAAILNERRIEFISEGIRGLDILRQNIAFPAKGTIAAVPPTSLAYVWPIPFNELAFNSLMTPNQ